MKTSMTVNGRDTVHDIEPRLLLVHYLRAVLHLTGTHIGCDTSQCGACTVLLDGKAVKSCTVLALEAHGAAITTIEGVASHEGMHVLQKSFSENHALQCGFCTPGMIMSALDLFQRFPHPDRECIREELDGNICRCTGYRQIIDAIEQAGVMLSRDDQSTDGRGI